MDYNNISASKYVTFSQMPPGQFLLGIMSAFDNRFQAVADGFFKEITWKQFFAIICLSLFSEPPTINELSEVMGSSHQNVKQILLKLEKKGFVEVIPDEKDRRKQRIRISEQGLKFCASNDAESMRLMGKLFAGISDAEFETAIGVIGKMEKNLKEIQQMEN
ncbi:MAG: MarR family transcriptional regulator [Clostridiales bacterium]|nr:MarR family transcriptional regulator [Clostridiales bacterium]